MSDSTLSNSPSQDGPLTNTPNFNAYPPIFVLSTHLTLDELHRIEDILGSRGARLTYDASEARIVLGRVGQKKRAALELRARGVWTVEVDVDATGVVDGRRRPVKRRRVQDEHESGVDGEKVEEVDLSTETEGEEDGVRSRHDPGRHLRRSASPDGISGASQSSDGPEQADIIKIFKLEWLDRVLESRELVPMEPFVVYQGRIVEKTAPKINTAANIMQRAREDAMFKKPAATPPGHLARRSREPLDGNQRQPPKLYRQTTSEHDEVVP